MHSSTHAVLNFVQFARPLLVRFMWVLCDKVMLMLLFPLLLQLGSTTIGLKTKDGIVLAVEKRVTSPLLVLTELLFHSP